jgi:hypothetical protein
MRKALSSCGMLELEQASSLAIPAGGFGGCGLKGQ